LSMRAAQAPPRPAALQCDDDGSVGTESRAALRRDSGFPPVCFPVASCESGVDSQGHFRAHSSQAGLGCPSAPRACYDGTAH